MLLDMYWSKVKSVPTLDKNINIQWYVIQAFEVTDVSSHGCVVSFSFGFHHFFFVRHVVFLGSFVTFEKGILSLVHLTFGCRGRELVVLWRKLIGGCHNLGWGFHADTWRAEALLEQRHSCSLYGSLPNGLSLENTICVVLLSFHHSLCLKSC